MLSPTLTARNCSANYFVNHTSHHTPDGGCRPGTDVSKSFYGPRLALDVAAAQRNLGSSLARLVNRAAVPRADQYARRGVPVANNQGAVRKYTQIANNGNLNPEVGLRGFDLGIDRSANRPRLHWLPPTSIRPICTDSFSIAPRWTARTPPRPDRTKARRDRSTSPRRRTSVNRDTRA